MISYFFNSAADHFEDALQALDALGAGAMKDLLTRVGSRFPDGVPSDIDSRNEIIDSWPDDGSVEEWLDPLEEEASAEVAPVEQRLAAYIADHGLPSPVPAETALVVQPGKAYWRLLEPVWTTVDIYGNEATYLRTLRRLTKPQRDLFAAHWCQSEVSNGGFHQFFTNPTGVVAPEAIVGFEAIMMPDAAAILRRAVSFFEEPYPRDQGVRLAILERVPGKDRAEWDPFHHLDSPFLSALDWPGARFPSLADAYALRHDPE